jgi:hypothetical protein
MNWGEVKVKNGFIVLLSCGLWSALSFGQGTLPSKPVSQAARSAAFRKNLKVDSIPRGAVELELKESIPSNTEIGRSEIFFRNVLNFDIDDRGHIYIPDGALCVVYELDAHQQI